MGWVAKIADLGRLKPCHFYDTMYHKLYSFIILKWCYPPAYNKHGADELILKVMFVHHFDVRMSRRII